MSGCTFYGHAASPAPGCPDCESNHVGREWPERPPIAVAPTSDLGFVLEDLASWLRCHDLGRADVLHIELYGATDWRPRVHLRDERHVHDLAAGIGLIAERSLGESSVEVSVDIGGVFAFAVRLPSGGAS